MKKHGIGSKVIALLLALAMVLPMMPLANAAKGDLSNVDTGLVDNKIDTNDTISLPIQILDYENDGMLFEYAEAWGGTSAKRDAALDATDFGASWSVDFTTKTAVSGITNSEFGDFWSYVTKEVWTTNEYASHLRAYWAKNSTQAPHTVYGRTGVILPNDINLSMDNARYLILVYRSNVANGKIGFFVERANSDRNQTRNRVGDLTFTNKGDTGEGSTVNWTYAIYDLKQGNLANSWSGYGNAKAIWTTLPMDASGEYIDIAHVALFANRELAKEFGEYALTDGSDRGDNRAFGLLRGSRSQTEAGDATNGLGPNFPGIHAYVNTGAKYGNAAGTIYQVPWNTSSTLDLSTVPNLGYKLLGTYGTGNIANIGLLESTLSEEGHPVYKEEVVTYLAYLLQHSLEIPERNEYGWKNYRYVKGTASPIYGNVDLATALRSRIQERIGSYDEAASKGLVGTWTECEGKIASYYDAAYFMLNSIFVSGSYNEPQNDQTAPSDHYDYLILSAGHDNETVSDENPTGDKIYVFDGGFTTSATPASAQMAIDYDKTAHTIQNTTAAGKSHFVYDDNNGSTTTLNPFLPVTAGNTAAGMTKNPYYQDDGVINGVKKQTTKDTTYMRDYNFALVSKGEFAYYADDELFFEFEGDDDVYLFINGELVMDIGSAHSIDSVRFELNDYVNAAKDGKLGSEERNRALSLVDGNTYSFSFFYMERHSYGSNMRIMTNIHVTDPSMQTEKTAWQDGIQLDFGAVVDKNKLVEYGFSIYNNGEENLHNLTFIDNDIGVRLDPENGLTVTGERVTDVNGGNLEASDLSAVISHPDYNDIHVSFSNNESLKHFLAGLTAEGTVADDGLFTKATVLFRGIGYRLSDDQIKAGIFDNTVFSTATNRTETKTLQSQANMRVFVPADPMYYEWAGHELKVSKEKLIQDILAAANQEGNLLAGKVPNLTTGNVNKIELVTKAGNAISSDYVGFSESYDLTINYPTPGSKVFYVKLTYNSSKNTVVVPILVNVTDVKDSVFVLDYGLKAELTANNTLFENDAVAVPGRATAYGILGIGSGGSYTPNEITFNRADSSGILKDTYGTFTAEGTKLTYTPTDFMEGEDVVQIAVNVYESSITPSRIDGTLNINKEVEMYKSVTVLPATVVYYEDDFPAITYCDQNTQNVFEKVGSSSGNSQGVDQDENYGHDDSYASDADKSGDSLTTITIKQNGPVAKFTFKGTGFELLSRTNAYDSATIELAVFQGDVEVSYTDDMTYVDASGKAPVRMIPVITEFDNGANLGAEEIYQVPVIRVDDLELNTYTVVIGGVPAYNWDGWVYSEDAPLPPVIPTTLYIDGLRIFQPMGAANDNYTADENGAVFTEIRDLIVDGHAAVATYDGTAVNVSTGTTTWTENRNNVYYDGSVYEGNVVNSVDDYLIYGPNNEVYMDGAFSDTALAFQVTESGSGTHALQVAIHAVDQALFYGASGDGMHAPVYYATADGSWKLLDTITSGTEMYYTIDYTSCPVSNGAYQIILKVDITGSDLLTAMASYTTIKTVGLEIGNVGGEATELAYKNGILIDSTTGEAVDPASYPDFQLLGRMLSTSVMAAPEQPKPVNPFADAEEGSFYYDAMLWAVENGITNGTSATTFSPDKQVTRAETVTFLWRAAGEPEPVSVKDPFIDVNPSDFYYKAVLWAVENGITNGMDADHFGPYAICNRAQVVTFLWRAADEPAYSAVENAFADAEVGSFYYDAMLWAVENGITNGIDATHFGPAANCNRAQIVTFLYRAQ